MCGRGVQSIGAAIVFPLSMTIGTSAVAYERRSMVIAALGITQGLASALGPVIGGSLTQFFGWRSIFVVNIPLMIGAVILCGIFLNKGGASTKEKIDIGALLVMFSLFSLTVALVQGRLWGWGSSRIIVLFVLAVGTFAIFLVHELKFPNSILPLKLFKNREFTGSAVAGVLSNVFLVAVTVILPTYFTKMQGASELTAAIMMTPITAMIFVFSPLGGFIIGRVSPRFIVSSGFAVMLAAYILFSKLNMHDFKEVIIAGALLGAGYGLIIGAVTVLSASDFGGVFSMLHKVL